MKTRLKKLFSTPFSSYSTLFSTYKKLTIAGSAGAALVILFFTVTAYYYFKTPANAVVVTTADFPAGLSTNFTLNKFTDHVVSQLQKTIELADSNSIADTSWLEGLGPRPVKQSLIPIRALSSSPSPVFNLRWKGIDLNFCRYLGVSLRAKKFLELGVIGFPQGGWRLTAALKERPDFLATSAGSAPLAGGACADFEKCADDLTEQILGALDNKRLLNFYIKTKTPDANRRILALYQSIPSTSLKADDLVAWGNAFYALRRYDDALQKYQEALEKDPSSCPAQVARGFAYYARPHGMNLLEDLKQAEQDFRKGIVCDASNEYTRTSLCHTLLQSWNNSKTPPADLLVEAKRQCEKALEINPQFVIAAVNLGYVLYRQGNHQAALTHFDNLSQRYPTHSGLFLNYGFLLYLTYLRDNSEHTLKQATAQTLKAWNLNQNSEVAADNLGYFYYEQGDYRQAVDFWKKANDLSPDDSDCLAGLALGTYKLGEPQSALAFLSRAVQLDPHYRDPPYLKLNNSWSDRATTDLTKLLALLANNNTVPN